MGANNVVITTAGERGQGKDDINKVDQNGFSEYLKTAEHDCVVIMPQCPNDTFWVAKIESIIAFIEHIIKIVYFGGYV